MARFDSPVPGTHDPYRAAADRYAGTDYRKVGNSGLLLPPISLGLWWNFGDDRPFATQREILRYAFDHGISHFDLANNYGPPYGSAEENFGRMMTKDFRPYRHEMIISTKAGWDMWPGPYGQLGGRTYVLNSLDESLKRMNLDYVDIFYSHRFDPDTPLEETIGALDTAVKSGKARFVGISSYSADRTRQAKQIADSLGTPLVIHQPSYSMVNRWIEDGLTDALDELGMGAIAFTALAQGLLTDRYTTKGGGEQGPGRPSFTVDAAKNAEVVRRLDALSEIARRRGQTLAQLALVWVLRRPTVTSTLIGASSVKQVAENLKALDNLELSDEELAEIDQYAVEADVDLWRSVSES
ncbi:glyceraldehyde 3-phosphate reductase [Microlunatus endophyticus]|uniref:Glyceraldehyde 3-phosphate reductase n=1 Tax=Microlunatus endophyticus TaxID=1716077 RepID=A0A917SAH0_9ACTN|nr:aldo/keto reductase [Microlunatus endophyticus]GGL63431.1 glyceraldehyde 3-phosphate reductase [Microlunatus endophyticus]